MTWWRKVVTWCNWPCFCMTWIMARQMTMILKTISFDSRFGLSSADCCDDDDDDDDDGCWCSESWRNIHRLKSCRVLWHICCTDPASELKTTTTTTNTTTTATAAATTTQVEVMWSAMTYLLHRPPSKPKKTKYTLRLLLLLLVLWQLQLLWLTTTMTTTTTDLWCELL